MTNTSSSGQLPPGGASPPPPPPPGAAQVARVADRLVLGIARHWVALFCIALLLYVGIPFLAPLLMQVGLTGPARVIYLIYSPACHQLPDRSYFLFGEQHVYSLEELEAANVLPGSGLMERRRFVGDEALGWKTALCQRDVAIYGTMIAAGMLFALVRRRAPRLSPLVFILFLLPIAVDGVSQLLGLRTSNWWLRSLTGALFGLGVVWLTYPYIQESMDEIRANVEKKYGW
ncbi:MAG TPA: DUF2085 domain-containing protein [Anaerolineae bacterium]|nr:DUF2085 domain-containing protein [Anaerolineae bacterium]HNU04418.1 DUF2085 domain-containing protein [Anaerolineae bacterium]